MATIPGTFWVPARRSRSCGPPCRIGLILDARSRARRAPTPLGPPNLWALRLTRSAPAVASARSIQEKACTASVWTSACGASSCTSATTASSGWRTPVSLLTSITETSRTVSSRASARASRSIATTAVDADRPPAGGATASSTAGCSTALHRTLPGTHVPSGPARTPKTARLSASVPPLVNTSPPGLGTEQPSQLLAGFVEGPRRGTRHGVAPGGVAVVLGQVGEHRGDCLRAHRRGRRVVQIGDRFHPGACQSVGAPGGREHPSDIRGRRRVRRDGCARS